MWFGKNNDIPPLELNGKEIEQVQHSNFLGIVISDYLGWDAHVQHIHSKVSKWIHYIRAKMTWPITK